MATVVAFDVNETLSDMRHLAPRLEKVGAPAQLFEAWFAATLCDGFALTAAGGYANFAGVASSALHAMLLGVETLTCTLDEAAAYVLAGIGELPLHPDVEPAFARLHADGLRLVTLTNGSAATTDELLHRGGVAQYVEQCFSVEEVHRWKPAPEAYRYAAERCGVNREDMTLVAVHPWDTDAAKRAGLGAAWINRRGVSFPEIFRQPDIISSDLCEFAGSVSPHP